MEGNDVKYRLLSLNTGEQAGRKKIELLQRQIGELKREKDILDRKYTSSDRAATLIFDITKVMVCHFVRDAFDPEGSKHNQQWLNLRKEFPYIAHGC